MTKPEGEIAQVIRKYQARTGKILTLSTVESATGGRISDRITNIPGSSDYYKGSVVSYSAEVKVNLVGIKETTIKDYGIVSAETALEMAREGRKLLRTDICLSITGIAGPTGGTVEKPVGLFYIGLASEEKNLTKEYHFKGNREHNKHKAADAALNLLKDYLLERLKEIENVLEEKHVVTCFLESDNKILILRRSERVGTYQGKWAGVSGYVEHEADEQAFIEIGEETGLGKKDVILIKKGKPLEVIDQTLRRRWIVHPFLFHVKNPDKIKIDWEHKEVRWIKPQDITSYKTVPGLKEALAKVKPRVTS